MIINLIVLVLWVAMGTVTFRRVGHHALATAPKHHRKCNINSDKWTYDDGLLDRCTKCDGMRSIIHKYYHYTNDGLSRAYCEFEPGEAQWLSEVCNCDGPKVLLWAGIKSYCWWPFYLIGYGYVNAYKKFLTYKGENWNFFVPAKMVKTKDQRLAELEIRNAQLEQEIKAIDKELENV